jgi:hypothetical protein
MSVEIWIYLCMKKGVKNRKIGIKYRKRYNIMINWWAKKSRDAVPYLSTII